MNHALVSTVCHRDIENENNLLLPELFYRPGQSGVELRERSAQVLKFL